jgi:type IV secretory pathway component VirB8
MKEKEKGAKRFKRKLLHKYRLVILNEETFEERFSFKLNRLNVFVFSTLFAFFLIVATTVIIAFTPLREYIPGYSSIALKKESHPLGLRNRLAEKNIKRE